MTKLFTKLFKLSQSKTDTKAVKKLSLVPYTPIPQQYQPQLGKGDLKVAGLLVNLDHLDVFNTMCCDAVLFLLSIYHLLQNLRDGDAIKNIEGVETDFGAKFHEKFKQILSQLSYVNSNTFTQDQTDELHFLFNDLKYTWNVITVANSLRIELDDTLKHNVNEYFKRVWAFEVSESDDQFLIDVFSVSLNVWESRVIALVVSKE
ncbi:hypothetical protein CORT_0G00790 [Candida orthopsilosis Co 90-125]|uniref:Uncharacterized protein n=1 Tax=Candida orthopsilosis (strain 90-125) TaxID=1136231 RepID=H8X9V1_CANO9|nr:hypothetical protein CORT_0G00790 [Candida orthopsilosis Co 90-125]CCG24768.1 hypothetical protein CORT_0G00790 [Candida orthopsilosis Co 90-125]